MDFEDIERRVVTLPVPVARYADSRHNACVSLFGEQQDDAFYDIVYHQAFGDTLRQQVELLDRCEFLFVDILFLLEGLPASFDSISMHRKRMSEGLG